MYLSNSILARGWNVRPERLAQLIVSPMDGSGIVDNGIYAFDGTQATVTLDHIGNRPCFNMTNSGSTATDVVNQQVTANAMQFVAGLPFVMFGSVRFTTTTQDWTQGTWATDTNYFSTLPTDYLSLRKLTGSTSVYLAARKASGTEETYVLDTAAVVADTWYDYAVWILPDSATAGKARFQVAWGSNVTPGNPIPIVASGVIATQNPDTVDTRPGYAWRAGSAANVSGFMGLHGFIFGAYNG